MKLTSDNIVFIDTYLDNSRIEYKDVRLEMVDHIASAIEDKMNNGDKRAFYYIFKDYMVENKAILLDSFKIQKKKTLNDFFRLLIKSMISFRSIVLSIGFFILFYLNNDWLLPYIQDRNFWGLGWLSTLFFLCVFWLVIRLKTRKNRFMAIEQMFLAMVVLTYCFHFLLNFQFIIQKLSVTYQSLFGIGVLVLALMIWVNFIKIAFKHAKFYKAKYTFIT